MCQELSGSGQGEILYPCSRFLLAEARMGRKGAWDDLSGIRNNGRASREDNDEVKIVSLSFRGACTRVSLITVLAAGILLSLAASYCIVCGPFYPVTGRINNAAVTCNYSLHLLARYSQNDTNSFRVECFWQG